MQAFHGISKGSILEKLPSSTDFPFLIALLPVLAYQEINAPQRPHERIAALCAGILSFQLVSQ